MSIVTDRLNANKPPPQAADPKSGKLAQGQINNNKDLDVDVSDLHIEIDIDSAARTLTIRDNGIGMSRSEVIDLIGTLAKSGTAEVRTTLPDLMGMPSNRTLGLILAGDDGFADRRSFGRTASPRAFGHPGAGGQLAFADPVSGLSVGYATGALDQHVIREGRRTIAIASLAADLLTD